MSKRSYTIIFVAVGENKGLYGARHLARNAEKWNIVAMLYNDMIGNSLSSGTRLSNNTKRVFSETIPYLETEDEAKMRKATNSDNGPSRQLARYIKTATEQYVPQLEVELVYRNDRFTWWRSYSFSKMDLQLSVCVK
jgi:Zn-dependent M28 family amino/carboxypeptidase